MEPDNHNLSSEDLPLGRSKFNVEKGKMQFQQTILHCNVTLIFAKAASNWTQQNGLYHLTEMQLPIHVVGSEGLNWLRQLREAQNDTMHRLKKQRRVATRNKVYVR